jgi:hypothetical protein
LTVSFSFVISFSAKASDGFSGTVPNTSSPARKCVMSAPTLSTTPEKSVPMARGSRRPVITSAFLG